MTSSYENIQTELEKKANDFTVKIEKLKEYMNGHDDKLDTREKPQKVMNVLYTIGFVLPLLFFIGLILISPKRWTYTDSKGEKRRNVKSIFWSSILFAIVVWLCIAIYYFVF